jgi:hypothetical protein
MGGGGGGGGGTWGGGWYMAAAAVGTAKGVVCGEHAAQSRRLGASYRSSCVCREGGGGVGSFFVG